MQKFLKQNYVLLLPIFIGFTLFSLSELAVRLFAPYFGNIIYNNVLTPAIILLLIVCGLIIGNSLAKKWNSELTLSSAILASGISLFITQALTVLLLIPISKHLSLITGPSFGTIIFFIWPLIVIPSIVNFILQSISIIKVASSLIIGGVLGLIITSFVLIPTLPLNIIILSFAFIYIFIGIISLGIKLIKSKKKLFFKTSVIILLATISLTYFFGYEVRAENALYDKNGFYSRLKIFETDNFQGKPARLLQHDQNISCGKFLGDNNPTDLVYTCTMYSLLYPVFNSDIKNILIIGGSAYSVPKALFYSLPNASIDVVEIEPNLANLAEKYFDLPIDPRIHNINADGRNYLRTTNKKYDLIFVDVYYALYRQPLTQGTKEFFELAKSKLNGNGIFIVKTMGNLSRQKPSYTLSEIKTFQSVFSNTYFFADKSTASRQTQNIILFGVNNNKVVDLRDDNVTKNLSTDFLRNIKNKIIDLDRFNLAKYPEFTNNYAPIEFLMGQLYKNVYITPPQSPDQAEMLAMSNQLAGESDDIIAQTISSELKNLTTNFLIDKNSNIIGKFYPEQTNRITLTTEISKDNVLNITALLELAFYLNHIPEAPKIGIDLVFITTPAPINNDNSIIIDSNSPYNILNSVFLKSQAERLISHLYSF